MEIPKWRIDLWEGVNSFARSCGGKPEGLGNAIRRERDVVKIEAAVDFAIVEAVAAERERWEAGVRGVIAMIHAEMGPEAAARWSRIEPQAVLAQAYGMLAALLTEHHATRQETSENAPSDPAIG